MKNYAKTFEKLYEKVNIKYWYETQAITKLPKFVVKAILFLWANILYIDYQYLSKYTPVMEYKRVEGDLKERSLYNSPETEAQEEIEEWFQDGCRVDTIARLGKELVDQAFLNNLDILKEPLTVYRTSNWTKDSKSYDGWVSATRIKGQYSHLSGIERVFNLPAGFPIISTTIDSKNCCDRGEVIIRFEDLQKLSR